MKSLIVFIIFAVLGFALWQPTTAQSGPPFRFSDNFETDQGWGMFEEIVGGSACYGEEIGEVARSTDAVSQDVHSLRVWANKKLSSKSNHVIAQKKIADFGLTGRFRYELYAYRALETAATGETGPEFSMQNTREIAPGQFRTATAGIQFRTNSYSPVYNT